MSATCRVWRCVSSHGWTYCRAAGQAPRIYTGSKGEVNYKPPVWCVCVCKKSLESDQKNGNGHLGIATGWRCHPRFRSWDAAGALPGSEVRAVKRRHAAQSSRSELAQKAMKPRTLPALDVFWATPCASMVSCNGSLHGNRRNHKAHLRSELLTTPSPGLMGGCEGKNCRGQGHQTWPLKPRYLEVRGISRRCKAARRADHIHRSFF